MYERKNIIYVYSISRLKDNGKLLMKVGETSKNSKKKTLPRVNDQLQGLPIITEDDEMKEELRFHSSFKDKRIHEQLVKMGFKQYKNINGKPTEWFNCTPEDAIIADLILSGYPVEHWSTKGKENLYEFRRILEELKDEYDTRSIKEQVKDLKEIIQDIKVFLYGNSEENEFKMSIKDIKNFPEALKTFEKECGLDIWQIEHILYNLQIFRYEDELEMIKKFKEKTSNLSSSEIELFLKLLTGYNEGWFRFGGFDSPVEVMNEIFDYFIKLRNEGCTSYSDLQERLIRLRKLEESQDIIKNIREVTTDTILEKMIPEELYSMEQLKNEVCWFRKHYGEKLLDVLKKDEKYIKRMINLSLTTIAKYVSLLRIDKKELEGTDLTNMNKMGYFNEIEDEIENNYNCMEVAYD